MISLITATINRKDPLKELLESLKQQITNNYEVIIVDQNPDGYLDEIINKYKNNVNIIHIPVNFTGVSRARNYGLIQASGSLIGFPDDDCCYKIDTLEEIEKYFQRSKNTDVMITRVEDQKTKEIDKVWKINSILDIFLSKATTNQIFLRKDALTCIEHQYFDEKLGPGGGNQNLSGEDCDILIRLFKNNKRIYVNEKISVIHHSKYPTRTKAYYYGLGRYKVIKKNNLGLIYYLLNLIQPIIMMIMKSDFKNLKNYIAMTLGRSGLKVNKFY